MIWDLLLQITIKEGKKKKKKRKLPIRKKRKETSWDDTYIWVQEYILVSLITIATT